MKQLLTFLTALLLTLSVSAQRQVNTLFIGNSYTEVNSLPQMVSDIATSMGDHLDWQSNTPGGCTFQQHCSNLSMQLIQQGGWDFVVLQEQSQLPSFPQQQVENEVFPYAQQLVAAVYQYNPCAEPMFYMTWGRKNGDAGNAPYFPILGTYEGMDSMLCLRYTYMAQTYDAALSPVGRVWNYLRHNSDIELYQSDESHPSVAGTYAAACTFYTMFFLRDPDSITYKPSGIPENEARQIRNAAHNVAFLNIAQWKRPLPDVELYATIGNDSSQIVFSAIVENADSLLWSFGDGTTLRMSANICGINIPHRYISSGTYHVLLTASRHCLTGIAKMKITVGSAPDTAVTSIHPLSSDALTVMPNPLCGRINLLTPSGAHITGITIVSNDGKKVAAFNPGTSTTTELDLSALPSGAYIIIVHTDKGILRSRIIKL